MFYWLVWRIKASNRRITPSLWIGEEGKEDSIKDGDGGVFSGRKESTKAFILKRANAYSSGNSIDAVWNETEEAGGHHAKQRRKQAGSVEYLQIELHGSSN